MTAQDVQDALQAYATPADQTFLPRFFKTGEGEYSAHDVFIGVRVPQVRLVCKQYQALELPDIQQLLDSKVHEYRLAGLIIVTYQYAGASAEKQQELYEFYLRNVYAGHVNNWDLVDSSAEFVIGNHLMRRPRDILYELARSDDIWQRRVAILSAFQFVKAGDATTTLELAAILLNDKQDLIQKAVGWQLREVGKRCSRVLLLSFLDKHAHAMPRTMLRYSIEHLGPEQRSHYMHAKART